MYVKGLHTDHENRLQPEGSYPYLLNGIFDLGMQSLRNEQGTTKVTLIPYTPIGSIILSDGSAIVFSTDAAYSYGSIYSDTASAINGTHTITVKGTDVGKADIAVAVTVTSGMTTAQQATAYVAALMADATFLSLYRAEIYDGDSSNATVLIRTTNGELAPEDYNGISITVVESVSGSGVWVNVPFANGANSTRNSAVGSFDGTTYTAILDDDGFASANKMNFQQSGFIEGTSRVNADLETLIYWTDDYNLPRYVNIASPPAGEFGPEQLNLFPYCDTVAFFTLDSVNSGGGVLETGAYYVAAAYLDEDGTRTNYFVVSPPIFVNDESDASTPDTFDGAPVGTVTNKSFTFGLTGLDENHDYVQLAIIKDAAVTMLPRTVIPAGGDLTYTHTGTESVTEGDLTDITVNRIAYDKARTMRQLDGRLYMGNLKGRPDIGYQRYANNIKLTCVSKEINGQGSLNFKDGKVAIESRSFRRDEVYAFYISWLLNDGGETKAYHIPGRRAITGETSMGVITFADAPSSFTQSAGTITYSGTLSKAYTFAVTVNGTDTTKTDVTVNVAVPYEGTSAAAVADVIKDGLNADATFAAEYIATLSGAVLTISTKTSITDPAAYNTISLTSYDGVGITGTEANFAGGVDGATASFGAGVQCELDAANTITTANISGQETGESIATKMETAMGAAGAPWTDYGFVRVANTILITASASGDYNRVLTFLPNGILPAAGAPTADLTARYTYNFTVSGASGTLGIDIDSTPYDEAFNTDADTTVDNWLTTHEATLAALPTPIYVEKGGAAELNFSSTVAYTIVDGGATMTFTPVATTFPASGITGGGGYMDGNENATVSDTDTEVADLTDQVDNFSGAKLFHFTGNPDGLRNMGYWENANEIYPTADDWKVYDVVDGAGVDTGVTNEGEQVRHHKFPNADNERFFKGTTTSNSFWVLGAQLSDIKIPTALEGLVKGFKIYYAERTFLNKTVLDQGLVLYGAFNTPEQMTQNLAVDSTQGNLYDRRVMSTHPFKAMAEDTNVGPLSYVKAIAKINDTLTSGRVGIGAYAAPSGDTTVGLDSGGEPLVREIVGKGYIPALTDDVSLAANGFTESLYKNGSGEKKLLIELAEDMPVATIGTGSSPHNYVMNLCMFKTDVYLSFMLQNLVWTGYWQESLDALASGPSARQHSANASAEIYGGDTFIGFLSYKAHAQKFTQVLTVSGSSGTLGIDIDDGDGVVAYDEAYASSADVTADNWLTTHAATLVALGNPITAIKGSTDEIVLLSDYPFTAVDGGATMTFTPATYYAGDWNVKTHDVVCESDYNMGMRHEGANAWEKYYPKSARADVITPSAYPDGITVDEDVDNYWGYDPAFSSLANVKYPTPYDGSSFNEELPTRVIRSTEYTGGLFDTFREFLPTDFIDLPRNRGELVKLQALGQVLIPHMERGILRTRGREELNTSGIAAFIGSGDIFAVSPDEIISTDLGYGGLQDQRASLVTEHGYFFVDRAAGKVFLLTDQLREISAEGNQAYFEDNLGSDGTLSAAWDPELRRILLTKSGSSGTDFTISYRPETRTWVGYHSYLPIYYVSSLTKLYSYSLAYLHSHNDGVMGSYYGTVANFVLHFVENMPIEASKQVAALVIDTTSLSGSTEQRKDTFDQVRITNSYQDTGLVTLVDFPATGWNVRRTKRTHKINALRDTLNIPTTSQFASWALQKRLVDNYHKVQLIYANSADYVLHLFDAHLNMRPSRR